MTIPIVALDVPTLDAALEIAGRLDGLCDFYKVGLELFTAEGPRVVRALRDRGADVFLDLKLHDIPNTVRGAVERAAAQGARLVTVHGSGGRAMLDAAQRGARESGGACGLLAVTVLTSLDAAALACAWGREGMQPTVDVVGEVLRLAVDAAEAGLHGVVCSGQEAGPVRARFGARLATLVPGVRLPGATAQDQARVVTPGEAARSGAAYVVLGRTVTGADDPRSALARVVAELRDAGVGEQGS